MYSQITANKRKTFLLIACFAFIIIGLGFVFGEYVGDRSSGIIIAVTVSATMILVSYFQGHSVALATAGAKKADKNKYYELCNTVENLSIASGIQSPVVYVIDDPAPNAFAAGRDPKHAVIAVTTGLLNVMEKTELEGVIAHEISHIKNYDVRVMTIVVVLVGSIMLLSDVLMRTFLHGERRRDGGANVALFALGLVLAALSPLLAELIKLAISRKREYLADADGALLTRYPAGLASALLKISRLDRPLARANHATAHLFIANPFDPHIHKKFQSFFSTHPPITDRIEKLNSMII